MPGPFPTPLHVAESIRELFRPKHTLSPSYFERMSAIKRESAPHDVRVFDVTVPDGRVYRVRVSDITPERVES